MVDHRVQARRATVRARLAEVGVPLFERSAVGRPLGSEEYARLVTELLRSGDARLRFAIPCLLAVHDAESAGKATALAATMLTRQERDELGVIYRLARCLVISREPYLAFLYGRRPTLPPLSIEPAGLPDPREGFGERGLWFVSETCRDRRVPDLAGGVARNFDTWLELVRVSHGFTQSDRFRAMLDLVVPPSV